MNSWRRPEKITLSILVITVSVLVSITPVFADTSWTAGRPTGTFEYRQGTAGPVTLSNTYIGGTASNDAQLSLGVEVYSFTRNWDGNDNDRYVLRIMGGASSRLPHSYTVTNYAAYYIGDPDHCNSINPCTDSGLTARNQGTWVDFTFPFFFWGRPYTRIFVCSNGWAAFSYNGTMDNCPINPSIPAQDTVDSNGVFHDVPESIIAPLAKPLDPSANPVGKIRFYKPPTGVCNPNSCQSNYFGVIWDDIFTQGSTGLCHMDWCTNSFSFLVFQSKTENTIEFGYHGLEFADPWNRRETVGLDDPSGMLSLSPNRDMAVCGVSTCPSTGGLTSDHGVRMDEPNYGSAYLTDAKISVQKTSPSDTASAWFHPAANHLYGYNIQTTVPRQSPDTSVSLVADFTESLVVTGLCLVDPPSVLVCFAIGSGVALAERVCHCIESLIKALTPQRIAPPTFQWKDMLSGTMDGFVETPVQDESHNCSPANQTPTGFPGGPTCAVDTSTFDIVEWDVPHNDPVSPTLKITYSAQTGGSLSSPGTAWKDTSVTLNLGPEGDFGISSGCNTLSLQVGGYQGNCGISLNAGSGFYGKVSLTSNVSPSVANGPVASLSQPPEGFYRLSSMGQASTNLAISSGSVAGTYSVTVTALSGNPPVRTHSVTITLVVRIPDFTISANPASVSVNGDSASTTITATSTGGFSGTLSLSAAAPSGITATLTPASVTLSADGTVNSALAMSIPNSVSSGSYSVTVTATGGGLTRTVNVPLTIGPSFSVSSSPSIVSLQQSGAYQQPASGSSTINLASVHFAGAVSLSATGQSGVTGSLSTTTVNLSSGGTGSSQLTTSVPWNTPIGNYIVTVTAVSGSLSYTTTVTVEVGNFHIGVSPSVTIAPGGSGSVTVTAYSDNSYSGPVSLYITGGLPSGVTFSFNPQTMTIPSGGSISSTLTLNVASSTVPGTYTISLQGNSGQWGEGSVFLLRVADFGVSLSCGSPGCSYALTPGYTVQDTLTVTSLGFSGTISLSYSGGGQTVSLSSSSVTLSPGGQATVTVTITGGSGSGTVTITGTCSSGLCVSPSQSHTASVYVGISCGCGGGGSVSAGTLITLADGSQVPVQSLHVGMQLLSYDMTTHQYVITTITKFVAVMTHNQMVIGTSTGKPLIVDQNPAQKLYVKMPDGTVTLMSVTDVKVGYDLFDAISQTWVPITSIHYENGGNHLMYDIYTTAPGNYIANGYLDPLKM